MRQWHCYVAGNEYGPMPEESLRAWVAEGRVGRTDYVWTEGMAEWAQVGTLPDLFPSQWPVAQAVARHRGGVVLALGILGLLVCVICGVIAWVMGNGDLREMAAGRMDPAGEGMTKAGKICGMISVILAIASFLLILLVAIAGSL
jgi:hypothetical protein